MVLEIILKMSAIIDKSDGVMEKEQVPLNKTELILNVNLKTIIYKR